MKHFATLLRNEIRALLIAPATYTAAVLFLVLMGWVYWRILLQFTLEPQEGAPAALFFQLFWLPVLFMVPLLTMKSIAEERRLGTLESLMTTPVSAGEIVVSKFLAAYIFYVGLWVLTIGFPLLVCFALDSPLVEARLLDQGTLIGGYLFVAVSGLLFVAIGIFASSMTRSQLVAGMLSFCILFIVIFGFRQLQEEAFTWIPWFQDTVNYMQIFRHHEEFTRGVVDSRPFFFYLSNTALILGISALVVEARV